VDLDVECRVPLDEWPIPRGEGRGRGLAVVGQENEVRHGLSQPDA
jgi:hypothetical protein